MKINTSDFDKALSHYKDGGFLIVFNDNHHEDGACLIAATEKINKSHLKFIQENSNTFNVVISNQLLKKINLSVQKKITTSPIQPNVSFSIDYKEVLSNPATIESRLKTLNYLISDDAKPSDFTTPGHIFPLVANPAGLLARAKHTEAAYDLSRAAGLKSSAIISIILDSEGEIADRDFLNNFSKENSIPIITTKEIINYRVNREVLVREIACSDLKTSYGIFKTHVFADDVESKEHLALVAGDITPDRVLTVRLHSECLTGDVFGSRRCDCGEQLDRSMKIIAKEGGILLYLREEGRGIGLANKLKAYELQDIGYDTVEANIKLGFDADLRNYIAAGRMLVNLGVKKVKLLTNNPCKVEGLEDAGINIIERMPIIVEPDEYSRDYLATKKEKLGHLF
ncbi:UNVERIFIED_CONTAM: hypothetical protein GTU68_029226 [Idotea baltica]|nr:hypothetical protein [Idotea baltica]